MQSIDVTLAIDPDEYVRVYAGSARDVVARSDDGRTVRFPADILRRHVTRDGIRGRFRIFFDTSGRFVRIDPIGGGLS
jgi:hypothetical protein